jgi:23S rRNA (adenine2030-N6)-methyltransferase
MLSYRHGFHAGNPADVLKHAVLIFCLDYLSRKESPCLYVDTHAGAGSYPLAGGFAARRREWEKGLGRLAEAGRAAPLPPLLARYLELAGPALPPAGGGRGGLLPPYPGSPAIMARFLRPGERLVCFELHPGDFNALREELAPRRGAEARREDGFKGLASLLPPPSRRACVLIDPPYEIKEDFNALPRVLRGALKRFPGGLYLVWYPLLAGEPRTAGENPFAEELMALGGESSRHCRRLCRRQCRAELYTANPRAPPANSPRGMFGSGLFIRNPPWTLKAALEESLPVLAELLGVPGGWKLQWEDAASGAFNGQSVV